MKVLKNGNLEGTLDEAVGMRVVLPLQAEIVRQWDHLSDDLKRKASDLVRDIHFGKRALRKDAFEALLFKFEMETGKDGRTEILRIGKNLAKCFANA